MVRQLREDDQAQTTLQSQLRLLPYTNHGRGEEHDLAVSVIDPLPWEEGRHG